MKKVVGNLLIGLFLISLVGIVAADGLSISTNEELHINKTYQENHNIILNISNTEAFSFYDIKFPSNNIIEIDNIPELASGQSISVQARIKTDTDFNGVARLRGNYVSNLGQSNKMEVITVDYYDGFDKCSVDIVEGDSIMWVNDVDDEIILRNADTNENFRTMLEGENFTKLFSYPEELNYYAMILVGIPFTQTCTINIQDDSGYVHSLGYDALLDLQVKIIYPPTEVTINFPTSEYTLDYNGETSDILNIKNDGTKIAKDIHLSGEWFTFSDNNFDLAPGASKNVGYTVKPVVYETNQTNITHLKKVFIDGNFQKRELEVSIFVNYKNLDSLISGGDYDPEFFRNFYNLHCLSYPDDEMCRQNIVFMNSSNRNVSLSLTEETFLGLAARQAQTEKNWETYQKNDMDFKQNISSQLEDQRSVDINQTKEIEEVIKQGQSSGIISIFLAILVIFLLIVAVILVLIRKEWLRHRANKRIGLKKREKQF